MYQEPFGDLRGHLCMERCVFERQEARTMNSNVFKSSVP